MQRLAQLRALVNRPRPVDSSSMTVQAYFAVGGGHLTATAGTTFPSQEIREGVPTRSVKTAAGGGGGTTSVRSSYTPATRNWMPQAPVAQANLPPMRVSEHAELAIENTAGQAQATSFFATPAAVQASNQALTAVASPVRLRRSAETITVPTNPNPNPAVFDGTPKTLSGVAAATHVPLNHPSAEAGAL